MGYREIIRELEEKALSPGKTILESIKESGKDAVGCFPMHTPEEIVYAANCLPIGMWGGKTDIQLADKYLQGFCCSIMRSNVEFSMKGTYNILKAIIVPTMCDTLKCIADNMRLTSDVPVIAMAYPQHRAIRAGIDFSNSEIKRVKDELEKILGKIILDKSVEKAFEIYEIYRESMREFTEIAAKYPEIINSKTRHLIIKAGQYMDKSVYTEKIKLVIEGLKKESASTFKGTKVVLTGLISEPVEVLEIFDESNIAVVGDDLSLGSRLWRTPARETGEDVYYKMAYRIADATGDCFLYEANKLRGQMLIDMVKKQKADAVVVMMMKFCDPEEFDYPIYRAELKEANIPELYLEIDQQLASFEQIRTRIQSFNEMLF